MRVAKDKFLVQVEEQFKTLKIDGFNCIDADFNPKALATRIGRIYALPVSISDEFKYDVALNEGDLVIFNHIVCQNKNKFSENIFLCSYYNIYAKIENGNMIPLEDTILCEKMMEPGMDIGCFKVPEKESDKYAKVFAVSKLANSLGIESGDIVFFTKNANYEMEFSGKEFLKMHIRNIIGIERNGKLITFGRKLLVKNLTKLEDAGALKRVYASSNLQTGVVVESGSPDVKKGELITYFALIGTEVTWKGQKYSFIKDENIKFVIA